MLHVYGLIDCCSFRFFMSKMSSFSLSTFIFCSCSSSAICNIRPLTPSGFSAAVTVCGFPLGILNREYFGFPFRLADADEEDAVGGDLLAADVSDDAEDDT